MAAKGRWSDMTFHGYHHITLSVTGGRTDVAFHAGLLGLRTVKRTVLLDGDRPFYHLYYGNEFGTPGSLLTSFVLGDRPAGRRGSGQVSSIALSVPVDSLGFWADRLAASNVHVESTEELGELRLTFEHPDGIRYQLVGVMTDSRLPWTGSDVPAAAAIRGVHSVRVSSRELDEVEMFLDEGMRLEKRETDGAVSSFAMAGGDVGQTVEIVHQPDEPQGSWGYMRNTVDHVAFDIGDSVAQLAFKSHLESMGFIDVTEPRDRNYFYSSYFRTPAGAMFEATWTDPCGFLKDEPADTLGLALQLPSWLADRADEYVARLEPLDVPA